MRALWLVGTAALVALAACTVLNPPIQCRSDDDCARFTAMCDFAEGVCVENAAAEPPPKKAFSAPLAVDAGRAAAPPSTGTPAAPTAAPIPADAGREAEAGLANLLAIKCGDTTCTSGVCCITDGIPTCTTANDCTGAPVACDDTTDCAAGTICCAYNDGAGPALLRASCVPSADCNADGPQDQLCDPAKDQCNVAMDGRTDCKPFDYTNAIATYSFCQ